MGIIHAGRGLGRNSYYRVEECTHSLIKKIVILMEEGEVAIVSFVESNVDLVSCSRR